MIALEVRTVSFSYNSNSQGNTPVLSNVSLSVAPGEFVSILGPSGCGKSTLLKVMAGLLHPTEGTVFADDVEVTGPSPDRTVIFQEYGLFDWKTVRGNIEFGLKARRVEKESRQARIGEIIELTHLEGSQDKYPCQLSGGMKQRAAIGRALGVDPECLLMDEPFGALDSQIRLELQEDILEIWSRTGKTIVMVTHNLDEAVFLSDRVIVLSAQPAYVMSECRVDLERPRPPEVRLTPDFRYIENKLWHVLRSQTCAQRGRRM